MNSSILFDTMDLGWFIAYIKGSQVRICQLRQLDLSILPSDTNDPQGLMRR